MDVLPETKLIIGFILASIVTVVSIYGLFMGLVSGAFNSPPSSDNGFMEALRRYQMLDGLDGDFDGDIDFDSWF